MSRTVAEASASAIVSCLFKILASQPNVEVLDQATEIIHKAQAMRSSIVDLATYEKAKIFVVKWPSQQKIDGVDIEMKGFQKEKENENASATLASNGAPASAGNENDPEVAANQVGEVASRGAYERFEALILTVLSADDGRQVSETENLRKERVALALALAGRGSRLSAPLAAILDAWSQTERSRPLREDIERARLLTQGRV